MSYIATIVAKQSFDAEAAAKSLNTAFKGIGTDEKRVTKELIEHTNEQRQAIKQVYLTMFGKSLEEDLKSELNGDFEHVAVALLQPRFEYEANNLRKAIKGVGTDEKTVIEILCTKDGAELQKLKEAYKSEFKSDLESDIAEEQSGDLGKLFRALATAARPASNNVDSQLAEKEAQELYDAGAGKFGTDESAFIRILASRSFAQLRATFDAYFKISETDISKSINSEVSGLFEEALIAIVESIRNRPAYFAKRLHQATKGVGTKDETLIRIVVSRSEIDMVDVRREYKKLYNECLYDRLKKELTGDFEAIMVKIVGKD